MAFDLNQFRDVYFAEVDEHLSAIGACLARMAEAGACAGVAGEAFRHAHSIKGASATFGHVEASALAGVLANVFDAAANRGLVLDARALEGCRTALAQLGGLLAAPRGEGRVDPASAGSDRGALGEDDVCGDAELAALAAGVVRTVAEIRGLVARMEALNREQGAIAQRVENLLQRFGHEIDALAAHPALGRLSELLEEADGSYMADADDGRHGDAPILRRRRKGGALPKVRAGCRGGLADEWEEH